MKKRQKQERKKQDRGIVEAILKNICGQHSMREMEGNFNKETCIDTLRIMSGNQHLEEMPCMLQNRL